MTTHFGIEIRPDKKRNDLRRAVSTGIAALDGVVSTGASLAIAINLKRKVSSLLTERGSSAIPHESAVTWSFIELMRTEELEAAVRELEYIHLIKTPEDQEAAAIAAFTSPFSLKIPTKASSTTTKEPVMTATTTAPKLNALKALPADKLIAVDAILGVVAGMKIKDLIEEHTKTEESAKSVTAELVKLRAELAKPRPVATVTAASTPLTTPTGTVKLVSAKSIFPVLSIDMMIPCFEWDATHPDIPETDNDYIFQEEPLLVVLMALSGRQNAWLHGHTGTGKSSLVKQVAARLNWPTIDIPFDAEITRIEAVGRDKIVARGGVTETEFIYGVLPKALSGPYILLMDEIDFIREDVAYVMQTVLADRKLTIQEDGGKVILADEWFRVIATANTQGQGDPSGLYRGARIQSSAFLDRFTLWAGVDYIGKEDEAKLIMAKSGAPVEIATALAAFAKDCRAALSKGEVMQPVSARTVGAIAKNFQLFVTAGAPKEKAGITALRLALCNRLTEEAARNTFESIFKRNFDIA